MIDCISVETMRQSDDYTIAHLVPSLKLMYRAAYGVFRAVTWRGNIAIVVGSGNNGGDGFALACILKEHQIPCSVFTLSHRLSKDSSFYADKAREAGIPIHPFDNSLTGYDIVVDCLLGTGFQGQLRTEYRTAIEAINASQAFVVSVDINSGMNGDTGGAQLAVRSDLTVTIGFIKNGLITQAAAAYIKWLICVDIGIVLTNEENKICTEGEWSDLCTFHGADAANYSLALDGRVYYRCPEWLDMRIRKEEISL